MTKTLILFFVFLSSSAWAGSRYCYLGSALVESVKPLKSGYRAVLRIDSFVYPDLETTQMQLKHSGLGTGYPIEAVFQEPVKKGQNIFFNTRYACGKEGCEKKAWKILRKEEANSWRQFCTN